MKLLTTWAVLIAFQFTASAQAATFYFHTDHLGSPQMLTDENQAVVWQGDYDPFGQATETIATVEQNLRFPGQYLDQESGLHYNYFRTYDPQIGRYTQSDPIGLGGGINTYGYVYQNALSNVDPSGLYCFSTNGTTTCRHPGGPMFSVPTPSGFPSYFDQLSSFYHQYSVKRPIGCRNPNDVFQRFVKTPTPGEPSPATALGTINNAEVMGFDNWVTSYLTNDINTGVPLVVNITDQNSLFTPGYVVRGVIDGTAISFGEGLGWMQSPLVTGEWVQHIANEALWGVQMDGFIAESQCTC